MASVYGTKSCLQVEYKRFFILNKSFTCSITTSSFTICLACYHDRLSLGSDAEVGQGLATAGGKTVINGGWLMEDCIPSFMLMN